MTIKTVDPEFQDKIGNSPGLSFADIKLANLLYSCDGWYMDLYLKCHEDKNKIPKRVYINLEIHILQYIRYML